MKSITKRLLTAAVALPILFILIFCLPQMNHVALLGVITVACLIGTSEMAKLLEKKGRVSRIAYLSALLPLIEWLSRTILHSNGLWTFYASVTIGAIILISEVFKGAVDNFETSLDTVGRSILCVLYPGVFAVFITDILFLEHATAHLLLFFALVFGEDTFAYFTGMLLGKNNKGVVKVSPNKSLAGFIGGIVFPAIIGAAAAAIWPEQFAFGIAGGIVLGAVTACFGALGDLIESTFKRSADVKDSGVVIPGRGGILDSIDSLLLASAPFIIILEVLASI